MNLSTLNVAIDLGGTRIRAALTDETLQLTNRREEATDHSRAAQSNIDQMYRMASDALRSSGLDWTSVHCLGIASPGPIDTVTGVAFSPPNMPGWGTVPLKQELEARTGVPVVPMNDASTAALGEFHAGAGRGRQNMVYFTVSTGIGGGVVADGRLLAGRSGMAAELGHMTIDRNGPPCNCGSIGCLEMIASGTSIARRFRDQISAGRESIVSSWTATPTAADVARAAARGDPLATEVFDDSARALGIGVLNCIHIFNAEIVVLGGGVTRSGELLFGTVRAVVERYAMPIMRRDVPIVPAELGEDAGLTGAAALARDYFHHHRS